MHDPDDGRPAVDLEGAQAARERFAEEDDRAALAYLDATMGWEGR